MLNSGIYDNDNSIVILATRIFDNVRIDLNRTQLNLETNILPSDITMLYAGGTGTQQDGIQITPHLNSNCADIRGELSLNSTVTYIYQGNRQTAQGFLKVPINLRMKIPEDSVLPFNVTAHYSFFSDNISEENTNTFSTLTDGVVIIYITSCMPVTVRGSSNILYNFEKDRTIGNENTIASSPFYPIV